MEDKINELRNSIKNTIKTLQEFLDITEEKAEQVWPTYVDPDTNLEWQVDCQDRCMDWHEATKYAESLGHGWRLPTIKELKTLINYDKADPAIKYPLIKNCISSSYWSSTTFAVNKSYAWYVNFSNGYVFNHNKTNTHYVRCVRDYKRHARN